MRVSSRLLDRLEQLLAVIFYAWFVYRMVTAVQAGSADPRVYTVLVSDGTILLFLMARRPTAGISVKFGDWLWALIGTLAPLALQPVAKPIDANVGVTLVLIGLTLALAAKLVLRRSFGLVAANRGVKFGGLYGLVRHPMYAGYMISHVGSLLLLPSLWNVGVFAVAWAALLMRIEAEERMLVQDPDYAAYAKRVRSKLIPGLY